MNYRIVYFVPDPFLGERIAIAALADGVGLVRRPRDLAELGLDAAARSLVHASLAELERVAPEGELPIAVGPQVVGGPVRSVPSGVTDPAQWIASAMSSGVRRPLPTLP